MIKHSRQREAILADLRSRRDHPTADLVYERVRIIYPNISLGTVYRNLSLLADHGQVLRISTGMGADHFDGFTNPHNHFICRHCGKVSDMSYVAQENIIENAAKSFDGLLEEYELQFFGICKDCLSKNK